MRNEKISYLNYLSLFSAWHSATLNDSFVRTPSMAPYCRKGNGKALLVAFVCLCLCNPAPSLPLHIVCSTLVPPGSLDSFPPASYSLGIFFQMSSSQRPLYFKKHPHRTTPCADPPHLALFLFSSLFTLLNRLYSVSVYCCLLAYFLFFTH